MGRRISAAKIRLCFAVDGTFTINKERECSETLLQRENYQS